jgi:hypothetical protein
LGVFKKLDDQISGDGFVIGCPEAEGSEGSNEGRDAPGELEDGGDGLGGESGEDVVLEAMREERFNFFAEQAGETQAEGDAAPEGEQSRAEKTILQFRQGGEQNTEERGTM